MNPGPPPGPARVRVPFIVVLLACRLRREMVLVGEVSFAEELVLARYKLPNKESGRS